jgi:putative peptidoglycan lipid II flippase
VKKILNRANKRISFGNAAALLVAASAIGQLLGLLRTRLVNGNFPAFGPHSTDAYFAAFKIPDFFYFTLAAGALGVVFMPFLAEKIARGDRKAAFELSNSLLNLLVIAMFGVGIIILVFADQLIRYVVAPSMSPEQIHDAATIMRFIAFNPMIFAISAIFVSVQQTFGRFFFYSMTTIFYNIPIIIAAMVFSTIGSNDGGPNNLGLVGLGIGALVGALLQLSVAIFGFIGLGYRYKPVIKWRNHDFRQVLKRLPPRSIDQGVDSLNSIAETNFASRLGTGKLSFYENAYVIHTAPTFLIGTTISTAAFPRLNDRMAQGRSDLFRRDFLKILRVIVWITLPVAVIAFFARGYLARLIYSANSPEIASILGLFTVAILFRTVYTIVSRWFYAQKDTMTPLYVSLLAIALNIYLAYSLSKLYGVEGLALAQSIVAAVEVGILFLIMVIRDHKLLDPDFWRGIMGILSVTGFTVITAYQMLQFLPLAAADRGFITLGTKLAVITATTFLVHIIMSYIFNLSEAKAVINKTRQIILSQVKI